MERVAQSCGAIGMGTVDRILRNLRFHAGQALPGISEEEAATIVHSELGLGLSQRKIQKLISKSRITDLRNGGKHSYVSARRLFWVIRELQAAAKSESTRP